MNEQAYFVQCILSHNKATVWKIEKVFNFVNNCYVTISVSTMSDYWVTYISGHECFLSLYQNNNDLFLNLFIFCLWSIIVQCDNYSDVNGAKNQMFTT